MTLRLLTEQHLEFICLKGDFTGYSESTIDKMPHCWKSHVTAYMQAKICAVNLGCPVAISTISNLQEAL